MHNSNAQDYSHQNMESQEFTQKKKNTEIQKFGKTSN